MAVFLVAKSKADLITQATVAFDTKNHLNADKAIVAWKLDGTVWIAITGVIPTKSIVALYHGNGVSGTTSMFDEIFVRSRTDPWPTPPPPPPALAKPSTSLPDVNVALGTWPSPVK